jgi:hypothetical protein
MSAGLTWLIRPLALMKLIKNLGCHKISQLNTMLNTYPMCIINLLRTMLAKMNQTSAFFADNLEVQVVGRASPYLLESGMLSQYMFYTP